LFFGDERISIGNRIIEIWKIPAVNKEAQIKYIEIYDIDIDIHLQQLLENLKLYKVEELMNSIRLPVFVVTDSDRCRICYCASNIGQDRNNLINLQSDVEKCLEEGLFQLDDCQENENWRDDYIKTFFKLCF
jgi:hypothetical protein